MTLIAFGCRPAANAEYEYATYTPRLAALGCQDAHDLIAREAATEPGNPETGTGGRWP